MEITLNGIFTTAFLLLVVYDNYVSHKKLREIEIENAKLKLGFI